ncbi:hypothetical protein HN51_020529 [Arachis hypogaea]|uniref:filament-like plant protein 3 n=1 Tax=Arachis hypogaea TaxID=3818 RepID=UPI000DEC3DAA|nr:filament-like plant protein 3 [Arachis hypogaea]XP_025615826.1 filament-like plant protein 3 [Arachis hypogaea]
MDRRSWLWRKKSPGETESSGSQSPHLERFSDDQVYGTQMNQSAEVMSKVEPNEEEISDVKILTERLSSALLEISTKEELVQQHAKVAEEAVSGWEKAENQLSSLKKQLDDAKQNNSVLEDRVSHLDGALKECMRQLRQAREDQEKKKIHEVAPYGGESEKSEIETQLQQRLEDVEEENSTLKAELHSRLEELELRLTERDLSTQAAEAASKQHLESIKKVAKLEAECRRLKAIARKNLSANDQRSMTASSIYVESLTDSTSDSGERLMAVETDMRKLGAWETNEHEPSHSDSWAIIAEVEQLKNSAGKNLMVPSTEINLMDDFLEMERLAAMPDTESGSGFIVVGHSSNRPNVEHSSMKSGVEALVQKNAELEKKLEIVESHKLELETSLIECQKQLVVSENRIKEAELKVEELQTQLDLVKKSHEEACEELKASQEKNEMAESKLKVAETEVQELISKINSLDGEIEKERALSAENLAKHEKLVEEIEKERALSAENLSKYEKLEDEIEKERALSAENLAKYEKLEEEIVKERALSAENLSKYEKLEEEIEKERAMSEKERALSMENLAKCEKLEKEILIMKYEGGLNRDAEIPHGEGVSSEIQLRQEKELALAASRFSECRKTIESLGQQLKSLATLEDFLVDSDKPMDLACEAVTPNKGVEKLKLHNNNNNNKISDLSLPKRDSEQSVSVISSQSVNNVKNLSSFGRFHPRSKSVSKRGTH